MVGLTLPTQSQRSGIAAELEDVDCIIALTHLGYGMDELLAEVTGDRLIIGGHSHTEQLEAIMLMRPISPRPGTHQVRRAPEPDLLSSTRRRISTP